MMTNSVAEVPTVVHAIQQSIAPVFLLTGVGAILSVLINRLSRIIDRFRALNSKTDDERNNYQKEMLTLSRRARWIHWAISLCTIAALLICIIIAALFIGTTVHIETSNAIALLFIVAMLALISGLVCFLREISLATGTIEIRDRS